MAVDTIHRETRYRFTYTGCWVGGGIGLGVLTYLDHAVLGVIFYVTMILVARAVKTRYGGILFDQRDVDHCRTASRRTLTVVGKASVVTIPALLLLAEAGYFTWTPFAVGVVSTIAAIIIVASLLLVAISLRH